MIGRSPEWKKPGEPESTGLDYFLDESYTFKDLPPISYSSKFPNTVPIPSHRILKLL